MHTDAHRWRARTSAPYGQRYSPTDGGGMPMTMTIKVYQVTRDGLTRVLRPEAAVAPASTVDPRSAFPDCQCPRCRSTGTSDTSYRVLLSHTTTCPACLDGAPCVTAGALGRAWRRGRA